MADHRCSGAHHWHPVENGTRHNLRVVTCGDYVDALEQLVHELGGDAADALESCMAGSSGEKPAPHAGTGAVCKPAVTWREVIRQTLTNGRNSP